MNIEDVDVGEYDEADRNYHEKLGMMYKYMVHVKPHVIESIAATDDKEKVNAVISAYANLAMTFGEFKAMTLVQTPNLSFKRKFFLEGVNKFNAMLDGYRKIVPEDNMVLTEAEQKIVM